MTRTLHSVCSKRRPNLQASTRTPYDTIGQSYTATRRPDPRIVDSLIRLLALPEGSLLADVGAGTGNYTNALAEKGYGVQAIEPSSVMRAQADPHPRVQWLEGMAERLPLGDASVDGVVSTLAIHHFSDLHHSLLEMDRVAGIGPIVLFTFDYGVIERPWQAHYFPSLWADMTRPLPPLSDLAAWIMGNTRRQVEIVPFLLPSDISQTCSCWRPGIGLIFTWIHG